MIHTFLLAVDFSKCKMTLKGLDYNGNVSTTASGNYVNAGRVSTRIGIVTIQCKNKLVYTKTTVEILTIMTYGVTQQTETEDWTFVMFHSVVNGYYM